MTTARGEEKVMVIDIFRERVSLRSAEGETRVIGLTDYNRELAALRGEVDVASGDDVLTMEPDEFESGEGFEDVSPELMFTSEHEMIDESIIAEEPGPPGAEEAANGPPSSNEGASRRRRGRRGGRRSRGGDSGEK